MAKKSFKSAPKLSKIDNKDLQEFEVSGIGHDQEHLNDEHADKIVLNKEPEQKVLKQKFKLSWFSAILFSGIFGALVVLLVAFVFLNPFNPNIPRSDNSGEIVDLYAEKFLQMEKNMRVIELELVQALKSRDELNSLPLIDSIPNVVAAISENQITIDTSMDDTLRRLVIIQLKQAVLSGESFQNEWENLYNLVSSDSNLQNQLNALMPYAAKGISTRFDLSNSLSNLVLKNGDFTNSPSDFYSDTINYFSYTFGLSSGVSISEQEARDMIVQAQQHLFDGDVQIAYELVANSSNYDDDIFGSWLQNAKNHIIAFTVIDRILSNQ
jgi:hypothetical protein